jgi:hypothetical protein
MLQKTSWEKHKILFKSSFVKKESEAPDEQRRKPQA